MLPKFREIQNSKEEIPTKTYKIDFEKGKIVGFCEELEAIKQAITLILETERYEYLIYSENYGSELNALRGAEWEFIRADLSRRIKEALLEDDRIEDVKILSIERIAKDSVEAKIQVKCKNGIIDIRKEIAL